MKILTFFFALTFFINPLQSQNNNYTETKIYHSPVGDAVVPPNFIPFPTTSIQLEAIAATDRGNSQKIYVSWLSLGPAFYGTGFCFSGNGGLNWSGCYNCMNSPNNGGYPAIWIWPTGSPWGGRLGASALNNMFTATTAFFSTDNGTTWTTPVITPPSGNVDRNHSCCDMTSSSPYFGRAYTAWSNFVGQTAVIVAAFSSDGGASWIASTGNVSPPSDSGHYCEAVDLACDQSGGVYAIWVNALTSSPHVEDYLGFAKSTNGGVSWTLQNNHAVNTNGIAGFLTPIHGIQIKGYPRIAVDKSGGPRNGWIYVSMPEKLVAPARDNADVCLMRSTDGGATWTHTLVNSDTAGNYNFQAAVCVDTAGTLAISYYDTRDTTTPFCGFYMSVSTNGGNTFSDIRVNDHIFDLQPIGGQFPLIGDYTALAYANGKFWPFWNEPSSGHHQVWTTSLSIVAVNQYGTTIPSEYSLSQNYPNPFNPSTVINYSLPKSVYVKLVVYDLLGREVETLVNGLYNAGNYKVDFDGANLASGVYLYRIKAEDFEDVRKMLLVK